MNNLVQELNNKVGLDSRLTLVGINPNHAVDLNTESRFYGWLFYQHPDGQYVTQRKLESWEINQAKDQGDDFVVIDSSVK